MIPLHQRDVLFCLHENGSITCRVRRRNNSLMASYHEGIGGFGKYSKTCVENCHSKIDKIKVLMTADSLMKDKSTAESSLWSILQYF